MGATSSRTRNGRGISGVFGRFWTSETAVMMTFAVVVGIGAGLGTIAFVWMIEFFEHLFFGAGSDYLAFMGGYHVIILPAIGGLLVGPIVYFVAPEAKGHGVPEVMTAVATRGGRIRPVVVLAKAVCSAITIGSGGSVGREGPIVQIGSALGSTIGQYFKLNDRRIITLVASGAAAGIAATFNAPIAGVMFALEVILAEFGVHAFSTIVIASVTASVVSRAALGDHPAFEVPRSFFLHSPWELFLYLGLGVLGAGVALSYTKVLYFFEDLFDGWKFPAYFKPAVGGLMLGVLGFFVPQVFGTGFETIAETLHGNITLSLLAVLIVAKIIATSFTLGSGASGGVFAPALFIGAVFGGAYGKVVSMVFPGMTESSGAYAMVGMAAVFAGSARAPITAIIILFEMTQDYRMILPLMFATVVSTALAQMVEPESIYTLKLMRKGLDVRARKDENLMRAILVEEAMTPTAELTTVTPETPLMELAFWFQETGHHGFVVLDENGDLHGVVTHSDLERAMAAGSIEKTVGDICTTNVLTAYYDETLDDALRHFGAMGVGRLPVVDRRDPKRLLGVLRRGDVIRTYSHALLDKHQRDRHIERLRLESATNSELVEIDMERGWAAVGKRLRDIALPADCVVVSVQRGGRTVVPRGHTQLHRGDRVVALAGGSTKDELLGILRDGADATES
ncbi:MAG: chloride channel protein [Candidatus Hydrogenedentes bacterium]|nr:chloride channel protein [Candidatus Hydrogenedentota bacterium]